MNFNNIRFFIVGFLAMLLLYGCGSSEEEKEKAMDIKVPVTLTGIHVGSMTEYIDLTGTSAFLNKSVIQSPTSAYVEEIMINPGDLVKKGQTLLSLVTKEAAALRHDSVNPLQFSGTIIIKAAIDGIITNVNHPKGDFILEGEPLITIAVPESCVFLLDVPYEMNSDLRINGKCLIRLSDGKEVPAIITSRLPVIAGNSQTQKYIIKPANSINLPENLMAKIRIIRKIIPDAVTLPKATILTDEIMKNFWVMKLINDSVTVKVPVTTGLIEGDNVEIIKPVFAATDQFLLTGNYGLGDTAKVIIVKKNE